MRGLPGASARDDFLSTRHPRTITKLRGLTPRKLESRTSRRPRRAGGFWPRSGGSGLRWSGGGLRMGNPFVV